MTKDRTILIILDAGYSGSRELVKYLNTFEGSDVYFKKQWLGCPYNSGQLPWRFDRSRAIRKVRSLKSIEGNLVGDAGHYYLNYVEYIIQQIPDVKIICTYRDKTAWLINKISKAFKRDGKTMPSMSIDNPKEAASLYYDIYKDSVIALSEHYSENFMLVKANRGFLKDNYIVSKVKAFLGIKSCHSSI